MEKIFSYVSIVVFATVELIIAVGIFVRVFGMFFAKSRTVSAKVVNKQNYSDTVYGKSRAPYKKESYAVTFECSRRKLRFDVSEISYKNYSVGQMGELTYKGKHLIDFKVAK